MEIIKNGKFVRAIVHVHGDDKRVELVGMENDNGEIDRFVLLLKHDHGDTGGVGGVVIGETAIMRIDDDDDSVLLIIGEFDLFAIERMTAYGICDLVQ